jgi:hypothetical protein
MSGDVVRSPAPVPCTLAGVTPRPYPSSWGRSTTTRASAAARSMPSNGSDRDRARRHDAARPRRARAAVRSGRPRSRVPGRPGRTGRPPARMFVADGTGDQPGARPSSRGSSLGQVRDGCAAIRPVVLPAAALPDASGRLRTIGRSSEGTGGAGHAPRSRREDPEDDRTKPWEPWRRGFHRPILDQDGASDPSQAQARGRHVGEGTLESGEPTSIAPRVVRPS